MRFHSISQPPNSSNALRFNGLHLFPISLRVIEDLVMDLASCLMNDIGAIARVRKHPNPLLGEVTAKVGRQRHRGRVYARPKPVPLHSYHPCFKQNSQNSFSSSVEATPATICPTKLRVAARSGSLRASCWITSRMTAANVFPL